MRSWAILCAASDESSSHGIPLRLRQPDRDRNALGDITSSRPSGSDGA